MIPLDLATPAAEPCGPAPDRITAGAPVAFVHSAYESADGRFCVGTWTCTPGQWRVAYDEEEYCHILAGRGAVITADGAVRPIAAGDRFVVPAGFAGEWRVDEAMTKTYVVSLPA